MSSSVAQHLAERFAADAAALRTRADALRATARRGPGPTAQSCLSMADACDRVRQLFVEAPSDEAVRALIPTLAGMVAGAASEEERFVYAGAVSRASDALDGDEDDEDDTDDTDDTDDEDEDDDREYDA